MVNTCYYPGCGKKQRRYNADSFHRLPFRYGRTIVKRWLVVLNIDVNTPTETLRQKNYRVCSAHFSKDDFVLSKKASDPKNPSKTYLKKNAVPRVEQLATAEATSSECSGVQKEETEFEAVAQSTPQNREDQSPSSTMTLFLQSPEPVVRPPTRMSLSGSHLARPPTWQLSTDKAAAKQLQNQQIAASLSQRQGSEKDKATEEIQLLRHELQELRNFVFSELPKISQQVQEMTARPAPAPASETPLSPQYVAKPRSAGKERHARP